MDHHSNRDQMYCHACHHQWQRDGESIDCPACNSSSTEIVRQPPQQSAQTTSTQQRLTTTMQIDPEYDPRHFHGRRHETAVPGTPEPLQQPTSTAEARPDPAAATTSQHSENAATESHTANTTSTTNGAAPQTQSQEHPRVTFRFRTVNWPPVAYFSFVVPAAPAPAPAPSSAPAPENPQPAVQSTAPPAQNTAPAQNAVPPSGNASQAPHPFAFGFNFVPFQVIPIFAPPPVNDNAPAEANQATQQTQTNHTQPEPQPQHQQQQQPHSQPQPAQQQQTPPTFPPIPAQLLATLLSALTNPSAGGVFGDAVYTQEAFERILTQLREQAPQGGPPPASQKALDRLRAREVVLDEATLKTARFRDPRCVVCVEDMVVGDRAAVLPCEHLFHGDCVRPWLELHGTCPVCRKSVEVEDEGEGKEAVKDVEGGSQGQGPAQQQQQQQEAAAGGEAMDCA
ncbi:hypothetical protein VTJ49DRAFT_5891 [Mycothermus thermophilus]|uniref:RING-type domain-containing protein n=1 Tax=Humicola insolens TaxID=85995 RepID=A0ABR3V2B2_HUMIN